MRVVAILLCAAVTGSAAELSVMSAGALESGIGAVVDGFQRVSGHTVAVQWATSPQLAARLSRGQAADVLISPTGVMDQAAADGRVATGTRTTWVASASA